MEKINIELFESDILLMLNVISDKINKLEFENVEKQNWEYRHLKGLEKRLQEKSKEIDSDW